MNNSVVIRERIDNIMFTRKMFNNYDMSSMLNVCVKLFSHTHHVLYVMNVQHPRGFSSSQR
jgi:hypothetical protein